MTVVILKTMAIQHDQGNWGEELACKYLREIGFEILERNWRYRRAEVDIISREEGVLVFTEVKVRSRLDYGRPEERVGSKKRNLMIEAAMAYMRKTGYEWEIRFDIVAIHGSAEEVKTIELFRDAFFPGIGG